MAGVINSTEIVNQNLRENDTNVDQYSPYNPYRISPPRSYSYRSGNDLNFVWIGSSEMLKNGLTAIEMICQLWFAWLYATELS